MLGCPCGSRLWPSERPVARPRRPVARPRRPVARPRRGTMGSVPHVAALYRYPIKGFAPEPREQLEVQPGGRIAGDRVLAFRYASATEPQERDGLDYWPKGGGLCVRDYPALTRLVLDYTGEEVRLRAGDQLLAQAGLDDGGRAGLV